MTITHTEKTALLTELLSPPHTTAAKIEHLTATLMGSKVLYTLILNYEYGKGNLQNVKLIPGSLNFEDPVSGTLGVGYDINEFSVCSALDYTGEYHMIVRFKIDVDSQELLLTGEERYE